MAPITILLPSQESPVVPTPPVQLPLPQNALDVQQAAVAPILLWQISPAIDRVAALSSRKIISELYSGLCAGNEAGPIVNLVQDVLKRICGVDLTDETTALIVSAYDLKPNDPSTVENFMLAIKGGLASSRLDIVRDAYRLILTKSGNPKQFLRTAKTLYNPLAHPRVRSGESSTDRILQEFLAYWTSGTVKTLDGTVELIEWEYYYAGISQTIERDDSFEKLMLECWPGLLRESAGVTIPDGYSVAGKYKRLLASKVKRLEALVSDSRTFRNALDLCMMRNPPPPSPPSQQPLFTRAYLRILIWELYGLVGYHLTSSEEEEQMVESTYKRVLKESAGTGTVMDLEWCLRGALRKECNFKEYTIVAKVAKA